MTTRHYNELSTIVECSSQIREGCAAELRSDNFPAQDRFLVLELPISLGLKKGDKILFRGLDLSWEPLEKFITLEKYHSLAIHIQESKDTGNYRPVVILLSKDMELLSLVKRSY